MNSQTNRKTNESPAVTKPKHIKWRSRHFFSGRFEKVASAVHASSEEHPRRNWVLCLKITLEGLPKLEDLYGDSFSYLVACSRLSVSEDDRKNELATNGISCEWDPGVKRRGRERINENHSIDYRLKVTLAARGFPCAVSGVSDVSIGFAAVDRRNEGKSFRPPRYVLLSCYSLRLFCKKIDFVTNNDRREKNRTAKPFPSEQLPYIRFVFCEGVLIHRVLFVFSKAGSPSLFSFLYRRLDFQNFKSFIFFQYSCSTLSRIRRSLGRFAALNLADRFARLAFSTLKLMRSTCGKSNRRFERTIAWRSALHEGKRVLHEIVNFW